MSISAKQSLAGCKRCLIRVKTMPTDDDFAYLYNPVREEWIAKEPRADGGTDD